MNKDGEEFDFALVGNPISDLENEERLNATLAAIEKLPDKDKRFVKSFFGLDGSIPRRLEDLSQDEKEKYQRIQGELVKALENWKD